MPRALVLGGETGLLGQAIVDALRKTPGWDIATLGRNKGPVTEEAFLARHLETISPDIVFNTIAWTQVDDAELHPEEALRINRDFPRLLARLLRSTKAHLLHYSTDFVFGARQESPHPFKETEQPAPESVYGSTKRAGEEALLGEIPNQVAVLRTAWLFGPKKKNFVATILKAAKTRDTLTVVDDQIGSPTYTPDLAAWSVKLALARVTGLWHTVNAGSASWYELARRALELAHSPCTVRPIPSSAWAQTAKRPAYSVLCTDKLADFLKTRPRNWDDALAAYIHETVD